MSGMKYVVSRGSVVARDVALRRNRSGLPWRKSARRAATAGSGICAEWLWLFRSRMVMSKVPRMLAIRACSPVRRIAGVAGSASSRAAPWSTATSTRSARPYSPAASAGAPAVRSARTARLRRMRPLFGLDLLHHGQAGVGRPLAHRAIVDFGRLVAEQLAGDEPAQGSPMPGVAEVDFLARDRHAGFLVQGFQLGRRTEAARVVVGEPALQQVINTGQGAVAFHGLYAAKNPQKQNKQPENHQNHTNQQDQNHNRFARD